MGGLLWWLDMVYASAAQNVAPEFKGRTFTYTIKGVYV